MENATLETDSHGVFHGTAYVKFRRPGNHRMLC